MLPSPAEQLESRRRLNALFRPHKFPAREAYKPKRRIIFIENPNAPRCPWPRPAGYLLRIEDIVRLVADRYNIKVSELKGQSRRHEAVRPRQIVCYLAKELTKKSLPDIGRRMGGRDHTTVLHSVRAVKERITKDEDFAAQVSDLASVLREADRG